MARSSPFHCITLALLILPPVLLTTYLLAAFPSPPAPIHVHHSLASLPDSARAKAYAIYPPDFYPGGEYVELPYGRVRYWLLGPEQGRKIVLIHGLSIPGIIWKDVAPALASHGYRVLVYDLYGRGYSDAPQTTYDASLYTIQLALLMQHVRWQKAIVCGVSMGGGIAAAFTSQFPHLVDEHVVLIAPAGLMQSSDISRTAKFMSSPVVQTIMNNGLIRQYIQRLVNTSSSDNNPLFSSDPDPTSSSSSAPSSSKPSASSTVYTPSNTPSSPHSHPSVSAAVELVRLQSALLPGYNAALSSSLRAGPIRGLARVFTEEDESKVSPWKDRRVLLIHGTRDTTVHPRYSKMILELIGDGKEKAKEGGKGEKKLVEVQGAGHDVTLTHASVIVDEMVRFFGRKK